SSMPCAKAGAVASARKKAILIMGVSWVGGPQFTRRAEHKVPFLLRLLRGARSTIDRTPTLCAASTAARVEARRPAWRSAAARARPAGLRLSAFATDRGAIAESLAHRRSPRADRRGARSARAPS